MTRSFRTGYSNILHDVLCFVHCRCVVMISFISTVYLVITHSIDRSCCLCNLFPNELSCSRWYICINAVLHCPCVFDLAIDEVDFYCWLFYDFAFYDFMFTTLLFYDSLAFCCFWCVSPVSYLVLFPILCVLILFSC